MFGKILVALILAGVLIFGGYYLGTHANKNQQITQSTQTTPSTNPTQSLIVSITSAPTVSQNNNADIVTEDYYNWYLSCLNQHMTNNNSGNMKADCAYNKTGALTNDLNNKLQQASFYDPILCAQNIPEKYTFENAIVTSDTATKEVHTIWGSSSQGNIKISLENLNNQWRISSIDCNK